MKVLLVENNSEIANALASQLKKYNINCDICYCGDMCLKILNEKGSIYSCLLIDNQLDDSSIAGLDLISLIRNNNHINKIPILFYSGCPAASKHFVDFLNNGVDDCMTFNQKSENNHITTQEKSTYYNNSNITDKTLINNHSDFISQLQTSQNTLIDNLEQKLSQKTKSYADQTAAYCKTYKNKHNQQYDIVTKPCTREQLQELVARIKSIVRRFVGYPTNKIKIGYLNYDLSSNRFDIEGVELKLSVKESVALTLLVNKRGEVCSREQFIDVLYGSNWAYCHSELSIKIVDVFLCRVRREIKKAYCEAYPNKPFQKIIMTYWGYGYCIPAMFSNDKNNTAVHNKVMNLKYSVSSNSYAANKTSDPDAKQIYIDDNSQDNNFSSDLWSSANNN